MNVPYLTKGEIEIIAEKLLCRSGIDSSNPDCLPITVEEVSERSLKLDIVEADLRSEIPEIDFGDAIGALVLSEEIIYIDKFQNQTKGRYRFTIAHEIGHFELHGKTLTADNGQFDLFKHDKKCPDVICRSSQKSEPIEWQANQFAGCFLMPRKLAVKFINNIKQARGMNPNDSFAGLSLMDIENIIYSLSVNFGVSRQAAKIRLEDLGVLPGSYRKAM